MLLVSSFAGERFRVDPPVTRLAIYLLSAALIVVDFNSLRSHGTERDTIWLGTGIFVAIVNIFVSLLNIFSSD